MYFRTGVRSLCVLVPVTGISWIIGVFYVDERAVAMQYIFCICNALQVLLVKEFKRQNPLSRVVV